MAASLQRKFKRNFQGGMGTGYTTSDEMWCFYKPSDEALQHWINEEGRGEKRIDEDRATASNEERQDINTKQQYGQLILERQPVEEAVAAFQLRGRQIGIEVQEGDVRVDGALVHQLGCEAREVEFAFADGAEGFLLVAFGFGCGFVVGVVIVGSGVGLLCFLLLFPGPALRPDL